jgi:hypothetical protein
MRPKLHSIDESLAPAATIADRAVEVVNPVEFFRRSQFVPKRMCSSRCHKEVDLRFGGASIPTISLSPPLNCPSSEIKKIPDASMSANAI